MMLRRWHPCGHVTASDVQQELLVSDGYLARNELTVSGDELLVDVANGWARYRWTARDPRRKVSSFTLIESAIEPERKERGFEGCGCKSDLSGSIWFGPAEIALGAK